MNLETSVVYITGGASQNDAIAQVVADVFGATVRRLAIPSACALGCALRGASTGFGADLGKLQAAFCEPDGSAIQPQKSAGCYAAAMESFKREIELAIDNKRTRD